MSEDLGHDLDSDESSVQVLRSAMDAPRPKTHAPRSVFDWRPGVEGAEAVAQAEAEVKLMDERKNPNRVEPTLQQLLCRAMVVRGDGWKREELEAALPDFPAVQLSNTLYLAKDNKRIRKVGDDYFLTNKGLAYASSAPTSKGRPPVMGKKPKPTPEPEARTADLMASSARPRLEPTRAPGQWPLITVVDMPARFAHYSDGGFLIEKNCLQISLSAEETRAMRTYQEKHL